MKWNGKKAAISITIDDSFITYANLLYKYGFRGTYYLNKVNPKIVNYLLKFNHEIGAHTHFHTYKIPTPDFFEKDIKFNINEIKSLIPKNYNCDSFAWPYGHTNYELQYIAKKYFSSARGYNVNELEDYPPSNFMNLKSINSLEHLYSTSKNLSLIDWAELAYIQEKWAIFVFHNKKNGDDLLKYLYKNKEYFWITTVGEIVKYLYSKQNLTSPIN